MTSRQQAYREFLATDFWKNLSRAVKERDGKCVRCGGVERLVAHHKLYRERWEDTLPEDLETLCFACHQDEHNQPDELERRLKGLMWEMRRAIVVGQLPWPECWRQCKEKLRFPWEAMFIGDLLYEFKIRSVTLRLERFEGLERNDFYPAFHRAVAIARRVREFWGKRCDRMWEQ